MNGIKIGILIALITAFLAFNASATVWTVGESGCDFTTIQDALTNSSIVNGDTVYIYNGTYTYDVGSAGIMLSKSIYLQGEGADVVIFNCRSPMGFETGSAGSVIEGITFQDMIWGFGIRGANTVIQDCVFNHGNYNPCIMSIEAQNVTLQRNIFKGYYGPSTGMMVKIGDPLSASFSKILDNTFTNSTGKGVSLRYQERHVIRNNTFSNITDAAFYIYSTAKLSEVSRNRFYSNGIAISYTATGHNNTFYLNDFAGNTVDVTTSGTSLKATTSWNSTVPIPYTYLGYLGTGYLGNFWDRYSGADADSNGIGDTVFPVRTTAPLFDDNSPLMAGYENYGFPPAAGFTATPVSGSVPLQVQFTDTSLYGPTSWDWQFGDGSPNSTEQNPSHLYSAPGNYTVNLTTTNDDGGTTASRPDYITVTVAPPVADFTADVTTGTIPFTVNFTDTSTGDSITAYQWILGDDPATVYTDQNLTHIFNNPGVFSVNHSVMNEAGTSWKNETGFITVSFPPAAPLPANRHVFIYVSNDAGVKYDLDGSAYGSGNNNTYYVKFDGSGLNEVRMTNNPAQPGGQVTNTTTTSPDSSGTFYITNRGEAGATDNLVLLIAVNGTIPEDFSAGIRSSGYSWTPNSTLDGQATDYTYTDGMIDETFTGADFLYGPQNWKPASTTGYPLFFGQSMGDGQTYSLMFIDLNVGALNSTLYPGLTDDGAAKVEYTLHNMTARAAFNAYGWRLAANQGQGISWTNRVSGAGSNGYSVLYAPLAPAPVVSSITPNTGINTTTIRITNLAGANFLLNPFVTQTVKLNGTGYADIVATNVTRISSTQLNCTFDLAGQPAGMRNVVVANPDGQEGMLENGFTITAPAATRHQAVFRHTMGHNWIFTDTLTGVKYRDHYGITDDVPLVGDFNNDGVMDRAVFRSGNWIVDLNMDGTVDSRSNYGVPTDVPLVGDFNNDGVLDRAVFRSGNWIVDLNMDRTVDSRTLYGIPGDIPLVGDLNNDGITDRAVFRSGTWIVDWDMDGDVDSRVHYGVATDIPLVGFFDDDAFMDRAVFRNGQWIIDSGFDGSINSRPRFGAAGDIPLAWVST